MNEISAPVVCPLMCLDSYVYKRVRSCTQPRPQRLHVYRFSFPPEKEMEDGSEGEAHRDRDTSSALSSAAR